MASSINSLCKSEELSYLLSGEEGDGTNFLYLAKTVGQKFRISLNSTEVFTQNSFQELIKSALSEGRDYIFILVQDETQKVFAYDGPSFCKWLSKTSLDANGYVKNCTTNTLILAGTFFIIYKNQAFESLKGGINREGFAQELCSLNEYLDKKTNPFYEQIIALSDPEIPTIKKEYIECRLILELMAGKGGLKRNFEGAMNYLEKKAKDENNPFAMLLLAACYRMGLGFTTNQNLGNFYYTSAQLQLPNSRLIYRSLKRELREIRKIASASPNSNNSVINSHRLFIPKSYV